MGLVPRCKTHKRALRHGACLYSSLVQINSALTAVTSYRIGLSLGMDGGSDYGLVCITFTSKFRQ